MGNHEWKRLKVGPEGGGYHIYIYIYTCPFFGHDFSCFSIFHDFHHVISGSISFYHVQ